MCAMSTSVKGRKKTKSSVGDVLESKKGVVKATTRVQRPYTFSPKGCSRSKRTEMLRRRRMTLQFDISV